MARPQVSHRRCVFFANPRGTLVDGGGGMTLLPKAKYPRERVEELHDEAVRTGALVAPFL